MGPRGPTLSVPRGTLSVPRAWAPPKMCFGQAICFFPSVFRHPAISRGAEGPEKAPTPQIHSPLETQKISLRGAPSGRVCVGAQVWKSALGWSDHHIFCGIVQLAFWCISNRFCGSGHRAFYQILSEIFRNFLKFPKFVKMLGVGSSTFFQQNNLFLSRIDAARRELSIYVNADKFSLKPSGVLKTNFRRGKTLEKS